MSGHNKWSKIKGKKGLADAAKGRTYSRLSREVTLAAKGGGDPASNAALRSAMQRCKDASMPNEVIERAIKKGTGEIESAALEEATYDAYGPGGVGIVVKVLTDNRNRAASEVRKALESHGSSIATQGSVSRSFGRRGVVTGEAKKDVSDDDLLDAAIDAGAQEFEVEDDGQFTAITEPAKVNDLADALSKAGFRIAKSESTLVPYSLVPVPDQKTADKIRAIIDALEELDDVQEVHDNAQVSQLYEKVVQNG